MAPPEPVPGLKPVAPLPIALEWFQHSKIDDAITLFWEPHVDPLLRGNIWLIRGRDQDLLVDSGLGVASLAEALQPLTSREPILVITHGHLDHAGSAHEFTHRWAHRLESIEAPPPGSLHGPTLAAELGLVGEELPDCLLTARPDPGYDPSAYRLTPVPVTRDLADGDTVELGDRSFTVLHLPGHSPGSIALFDAQDGTLFSGDFIYDGGLLDDIVGADRAAYRATMRRLRELPVSVVHAGHGPSFDRNRLHVLIDAYLAGGREIDDA